MRLLYFVLWVFLWYMIGVTWPGLGNAVRSKVGL